MVEWRRWGPSKVHVETSLNVSKGVGTVPGGPCTVRSNVSMGPGSLYGEVQCIMGNVHMGPPSHSTAVNRQI